MVLKDLPRATMASDQPVKKKLRIDAPDISGDSESYSDDADTPPRSSGSPDSGTVSEDALDCPSLVLHRTITAPVSVLCEPPHDDTFESDLKVLQSGLVRQCLCRVDSAVLTRPFDRRLDMASWPATRILKFLSTTQLLFDVYLKQNNTGTICTCIMHVCDTLVRNQHDWVTELVELADNKSRFVVFVASRALASFLIVAKDTVDQMWLQHIVENVYLFDTFNRITVQKINFSLDVIKRIVEWKDVEQHPLEDGNYVNTANHVDENNPFRLQSGHTTVQSSSSLNAAPSTSRNESNASTSGETDRTFKLQEPVFKFPASPDSTLAEPSEPPVTRLDRVNEQGCMTTILTDSESFDTSHIKCLTIKTLQNHWSTLVKNIKQLLMRYLNLANSENCILTFFSLWENIISVKANLSVIDTKPFYADLQGFVELLRMSNLPPLIYGQLLSLFNEVLCYGSTLALQDMLPEEICTLAHSIVRFVKDNRLLSEIQITNNRAGFGFIGADSPVVRNYSLMPEISSTVALVDQSYGQEEQTVERVEVDKTMLQKISLLVLKSVAVTVKEMRCDSSDSSIDSSDYNAIQDMQIVERSIRDVLKKVDSFIKNTLEFHPETPFTKMLIHLFSEQDDYLIESMVCTLDITVGIVYRNSVYPDLIPMLNPINTFIEFLKVVSHDCDVLLDYLVSNETCFLLYLLRFLKYVRRNWPGFLEACQASDSGSRGLDDTMGVLIRLRLHISRLVSKSLFPYNISPVLRLLEVCESLYEGNELS